MSGLLTEAMTKRVKCPDGFTEVRHIAPIHFDGPACPQCSDAEYADRMQREDPCAICRLLPDYEAAVDALAHFLTPGHAAGWRDCHELEQARAALARLREQVPA